MNIKRTIILVLLLVLPVTVLNAQSPKPGVGWQSRSGTIIYARGNCMGQSYSIHTEHNPWSVIGDPYAFVDSPADPRYGHLYSDFSRLFCLRYDRYADCHCEKGGTSGTSPHGVTAKDRLITWYNLQPSSHKSQWNGLPTLLEQQDVSHSSSEWCRLNTAVGISCGSSGSTCGNGWRCTPLIDLPVNERIGYVITRPNGTLLTVRARVDNTPAQSTGAVSYFDAVRAVLWVRQTQAAFEGLPSDCQTVASLKPSCWETPLPVPPPTNQPDADITVDVGNCVAGGRVVSVESDNTLSSGVVSREFNSVIQSTGQTVLVTVPVCP